jgi:hypothetical protein
VTKYDPEIWLESATRCLKEYTEAGFDAAVQDDQSHDSGLEVFTIVMEFPSDEMILDLLPNKQSMVHFELDDIQDYSLGFGDNTAVSLYDPVLHTVTQQEGRRHQLNFDVGIWSWDKSGGTTARLRARQILTNLFTGAQASDALRAFTDGNDGQLEILNFSGGHFTTEAVNDVRVFRQINSTLEIRVFSRTPNPIIEPSIEDVNQNLELIIEPNLPVE